MKKKNIKKYIIIMFIVLIAIVILRSIYIDNFGIYYPTIVKPIKANLIFGYDLCEYDIMLIDVYKAAKNNDYEYVKEHYGPISGIFFPKWRCNICKKAGIYSDTLCSDCANATNRCEVCSGIKILDDKTRTDYEHYIWDIVYHYYD